MEADSRSVVAGTAVHHSKAAVEGSDQAGDVLLGEKRWV